MITITQIAVALQLVLLLYVAATDIAARIIPNAACLAIVVLASTHLFIAPEQMIVSISFSAVFFALLLTLFSFGFMGGGDVKLLGAFSFGLPFSVVIQFASTTVLAGGALALVHLVMRRLPYPTIAPIGSSYLRRVYAVERWRHLRHAPLPYGVAIACGGIWTVLSQGV